MMIVTNNTTQFTGVEVEVSFHMPAPYILQEGEEEGFGRVGLVRVVLLSILIALSTIGTPYTPLLLFSIPEV